MEPPKSALPPCRICGGLLEHQFDLTVLGRHTARFHRCASCRSLIVPDPTWLEESYRSELTPNPDQGALDRCLFIHRCIRRMRSRRIGIIPRRARTLDFGAGRGFLVRLLRDDGQDAWGYDPYPIPVLAEDRIHPDLPEGPFDLVTAIEVLEHTLDPVPTLQRLKDRLQPKGLLVVSTELYDEAQHGKDWEYLAPEHGQHITIFSPQGLKTAADRAGLHWIGSLPWGRKSFVHLMARPGFAVSAFTLWRLKRRTATGERRLRRDSRI